MSSRFSKPKPTKEFASLNSEKSLGSLVYLLKPVVHVTCVAAPHTRFKPLMTNCLTGFVSFRFSLISLHALPTDTFSHPLQVNNTRHEKSHRFLAQNPSNNSLSRVYDCIASETHTTLPTHDTKGISTVQN